MDIDSVNSPLRRDVPMISGGGMRVEPEKGAETPSLTVSMSRADGSAGAEGIDEIDESALTRDDALGALMGRAFNLPPPPMPAFEPERGEPTAVSSATGRGSP